FRRSGAGGGADRPRLEGPAGGHRRGAAPARAGAQRAPRARGGAGVKEFAIAVPCSTSNLGAGFDAVGMALGGPALRVKVSPGGSELRIASLEGEGASELPRDATNRVLVAAR